MKFCTSCGQESNRKVCPSCGVKENKEHKYCGWCGEVLNEKASVCTKCGEKVKPSKLPTIIWLLIGIGFLICAFCSIVVSKDILSAIIAAAAGIICLPFAGKMIKNVSFGKKALKPVLSAVRIILVVVLFVAFCFAIPSPEFEVYSEEATDAAVVVFHEEVQLKNESSFVVNDSDVTYLTEPYNGNKDLLLVTVVLDYSAQNGFGGNNRDTYTIELIFDKTGGDYHRMDGTLIR